MEIDDERNAIAALTRYGYYRLSGYWYQFRVREEREGRIVTYEDFIPGTSFENILEIYEFDRKLRVAIFEALEKIEIALRFHIGHTLGFVDSEAISNPDLFKREFFVVRSDLISDGKARSPYEKLVSSINRNLNQSSEDFVKHHRERYGGRVPIWALTEVMTFSQLQALLLGLADSHLNQIAKNIGLTDKTGDGIGGVLLNWLECLIAIRNIVAHHGRLWNRTLNKKLIWKHLSRFEESKHIFQRQVNERISGITQPSAATGRIYGPLVIILTLCKKMSLGDETRTSLIQVMDGLPRNAFESQMGFEYGWRTEGVWL